MQAPVLTPYHSNKLNKNRDMVYQKGHNITIAGLARHKLVESVHPLWMHLHDQAVNCHLWE